MRKTKSWKKKKKKEARYFTSYAMWPNCAKELQLHRRVLMTISQLPFNITLSTPSSRANSSPRLAAKVLTSRTVEGSRTCRDSEVITKSASLRITTPILARFALLKKAPSKLSLNHDVSRGYHDVFGLIEDEGARVWCQENSSYLSFVCSRICPRVPIALPSQRLFRQFHRAQTTILKKLSRIFC